MIKHNNDHIKFKQAQHIPCSFKSLKDGSGRVAKFLQESILISFDFIWKVLLSDKNFATLLDPPLISYKRYHKRYLKFEERLLFTELQPIRCIEF